ncbi:uncharacterized protein GVI51_M07337 [Nakaseomyces glabratus]|uniref:C3H1-type domain-containing protein n=1 Tax=Candida glabrata (strain ATCC 2001 / BCRC 20586 / JCM 3761 / NBRC 0622 / NRRL Y-65 / CBS 138) TaxID=284593 RepID=Q6FJC6_CANGA|nr:uncharacterized protein CAGL0M07359g [Nakaseomyces glabratus]KAH7593853.1 CCCH-type zinc finger [Nakaseomyces glabratus]KAH7600304.1 CCCH-type zinc finger [Nakaseomyces glabratus]QHS69353.1 uncharacterized protein GVI51_M07337 [Nakaseomyces glabratus]CAG62644.1 unnamed protein product [Nakaseomyces glabratus]|eukprot:XP_449668.1 uncharacterized protein CAGL0M07359g [[Candida] glabrata]
MTNVDLSKFSAKQQQLILQCLAITNQVNQSKNIGSGSQNKYSRRKDCSHIPCKFYMVGSCQAGQSCPFSHQTQTIERAYSTPCKYYQKGYCKFGDRCINLHIHEDQNEK